MPGNFAVYTSRDFIAENVLCINEIKFYNLPFCTFFFDLLPILYFQLNVHYCIFLLVSLFVKYTIVHNVTLYISYFK